MGKAKLALNIALMLEMIRAKGLSDEELISVITQQDAQYFEQFGKGKPDWETFLQFTKDNWERSEQAIREGYEIVFLTFNALKSLLKIKFNLDADVDYEVGEKDLRQVILAERDLKALKEMLSKNWTIVEEAYDPETKLNKIRIELTRG